jgi:hypothetical protein
MARGTVRGVRGVRKVRKVRRVRLGYGRRLQWGVADRHLRPGVQTCVARGLALALVWLLAGGSGPFLPDAMAQDAGAPQPSERDATAEPRPAPTVDVDDLPISIERIQKGLARQPAMTTVPSRPIFRLEVFGEQRRLAGDIDWLDPEHENSAYRPNGPRWHNEFLSMVTPPEARAYGAFSPGELLQVAVTSLAQALGTRAVVGAVKSATRDRRQRQAEAEVDAAIAAWKAQRQAVEPLPAPGTGEASPRE